MVTIMQGPSLRSDARVGAARSRMDRWTNGDIGIKMQLRMLRTNAINAEAVDLRDNASGLARGVAGRMMDQDGFRTLYEQAAPRLRDYLRRAAGPAGDSALADDLLQESFLRLLAMRLPAGVLADERQLRAYIYRIATNLLTDHWRRIQRERRWSLLNFFAATGRGSVRAGGYAEARGGARNEVPDASVEHHDPALSVDMARAFARLKPQEQSLLWLAYVEGFDHAEIAVALNVGAPSVRVLLHRARQRLAELYPSPDR